MNVVLYLVNFGLFSLSLYKENWGAAALFGLVCIVMALALLARDLIEAFKIEGEATRSILRCLDAEQRRARWDR